MSNIIKIFLNDVKHIATNVVAVVIIMGLSILPSLYAWFNIFSNWDPYGPDATGNIKVAVFSEDEGASIIGMDFNIGNNVTEGLQSNNTIGWVFTENLEDTITGVNSGEFYAALVIPKDFSSSLLSFISGDAKHPAITYYENQKANAIAPKITQKAKKAVQQQINTSFVNTIASSILKSSSLLENDGEDNDSLAILTDKIDVLSMDLTSYLMLLKSFSSIITSAKDIIDISLSILPNIENMVESSESAIKTMQTVANSSQISVNSISNLLLPSMDIITSSLESFERSLNTALDTINTASNNTIQTINTISTMMPYIKNLFDTAMAPIEPIANAETKQCIQNIRNSFNSIETDLNNLSTAVSNESTNMTNLRNNVTAEVTNCKTAMIKLKTDYQTKVVPALNETISKSNTAINSALNIINALDIDFSAINRTLNQYNSTLSLGDTSLADSIIIAEEILDTINTLRDNLNNLETNENYQTLLTLLSKDTEETSDFISSPVNLETKKIYEIENYGSAMAPFYTILAIWVGALILVAIIHVHVKPVPTIANIEPYQAYFGRYITFFLIGQAQTLVTVLGNLLFIQIQCLHPFKFWLACSLCSTVFTIFIYSLTVAFGNVGEAIAVIFMVIQVAGAGCTFPIETLPKVFQSIYAFLPFQFGMNAMKETVAGTYGHDYWIYMLKLLAYIVLSLMIGLLLEKPCKKLNKIIEKNKEKSGIML